jgi:hypothetical protein
MIHVNMIQVKMIHVKMIQVTPTWYGTSVNALAGPFPNSSGNFAFGIGFGGPVTRTIGHAKPPSDATLAATKGICVKKVRCV